MTELAINFEHQDLTDELSDSKMEIEQLNRTLESVRPGFGPGIWPELAKQNLGKNKQKYFAGGKGWQEFSAPYRHFIANDVFDMETYAELARIFSLVVETTAGTREGRYKMKRVSENNDCLILGLTDRLAAKIPPLFAEEWLRSLADLLGLKFLPRVEGAFHSNPQGSRTGWIHTDCCSAWFDESNGKTDTLMLPPRKRCDYFTGKPKAPDVKPKEYIRAATLIFYLCNDGWEPGDGGETGVYKSDQDTDDSLVKLIPPRNNSLFLFECSPHSYHRFVTNPGRTRNSIIMWLHATVSDAEARWGNGINRRDAR